VILVLDTSTFCMCGWKN